MEKWRALAAQHSHDKKKLKQVKAERAALQARIDKRRHEVLFTGMSRTTQPERRLCGSDVSSASRRYCLVRGESGLGTRRTSVVDCRCCVDDQARGWVPVADTALRLIHTALDEARTAVTVGDEVKADQGKAAAKVQADRKRVAELTKQVSRGQTRPQPTRVTCREC